MTTHWKIRTHGDPLGSLRAFLQRVWRISELDGLLAPLMNGDSGVVEAVLLEEPDQLERVNPFIPLMRLNAARIVPDRIKSHPGERIGVMLRPCEMRALVEISKHNSLKIQDILTVCIDCLGTFLEEDFQWRANRKGGVSGLTDEALQFARQGGIVPYRYRSACQMCVSPVGQGADLNISVLGLPIRNYVMINTPEASVAKALRCAEITDGPADSASLAVYNHNVAKIIARRARTYENVSTGLASTMPRDVSEVAQLLGNCYDCQECLNACPICSVDYPSHTWEGVYSTQDITRWLISCSGCGMCEQACPNYLPLSAIFMQIRDRLGEEYSYSPGYSVEEPLPVS